MDNTFPTISAANANWILSQSSTIKGKAAIVWSVFVIADFLSEAPRVLRTWKNKDDFAPAAKQHRWDVARVAVVAATLFLSVIFFAVGMRGGETLQAFKVCALSTVIITGTTAGILKVLHRMAERLGYTGMYG